jgi:acetyltransferase-like isoleucine patch superfamily enzyme
LHLKKVIITSASYDYNKCEFNEENELIGHSCDISMNSTNANSDILGDNDEICEDDSIYDNSHCSSSSYLN